MNHKPLLFLTSFYLLLSCTKIGATDEAALRQFLECEGVLVSPNKSAVINFAAGGLNAVSALKKRQTEEAQARQQEGFVRQLEDEKRSNAIRQAAATRELKQARKKAEESKAKELASQEARSLRRLEDFQREAEQSKAKELRLLEGRASSRHAHIQKEAEERSAKKLAEQQDQAAQHLERVQKEAELREEKQTRELEAVRQALEAERQKKNAVDSQLIAGKLQEAEEKLKEAVAQRNDLLSQFTALRGGQSNIIPGRSVYIPLSKPYIHTHQLKEPNTQLDQARDGNLKTIETSVDSLLQELNTDTALRPVQKKLALSQLARLKEGAENFEIETFLRTFNVVQGQLPTNLASSQWFKQIEESVTWFEQNRSALSNVGEHHVYEKRQTEVAKIVQAKTVEFEEFLEDYVDHTIEDTCSLLSPTPTDEDSVRLAKLDFCFQLRTSSIPALKIYFEKTSKFGTNDYFLTQTFLKIGKIKQYEQFKAILQLYYTICNGIGEHAKLAEELLNYQLFQRRFREAQSKLKELDFNQIKDTAVKSILTEMMKADVLAYDEVKTAILASKVPGAIKTFFSKIPIVSRESTVAKVVEKILIAYSQIDYFSKSLRAANPVLLDFHEEREAYCVE